MHLQKRVLVTGGAGFIGSFICEKLLAQGHEVLCVDNFYTSSRHNIEPLIGHKRFELMRHDVTFPLFVEVDEIYNLAGQSSVGLSFGQPVETLDSTIFGPLNTNEWNIWAWRHADHHLRQFNC